MTPADLETLDLNKKIALRPDEIIMKFIQARLVNGEYLCFYNITILTKRQRQDPSFILMMSNVDQLSYKKAILENIPPQDRKFFTLKKIDSFGAILYLEVNIWIDAAFKNVTPKIEQLGFKKTYKPRVLPPRVMAYDPFMKSWQDFICLEFSKWIVKNRKEADVLQKIFPTIIAKRIKENNINKIVDFAYDTGTNNMLVSLKPVWVMSIMFAAAQFGEKSAKDVLPSDIPRHKDFFWHLDKELASFNDDKWKDFLTKKNLRSIIK